MKLHANHIAGRWVDGGDAADNVNPSDTRDVVGRYARATPDQAREAIAAASDALPRWAVSTPQQRADAMDFVGPRDCRAPSRAGRSAGA